MALTKVQGLGLGSLDDNITFSTAGKGVHLGVTSATASNLIDDYEEGTFTPTFSGGYSSISYNTQVGFYTKIGNTVRAYFQIGLNSATAGGTIVIVSGLPFTSLNNNDVYVTASHYVASGANPNSDAVKPLVFPNTNAVYMYYQGTTGVSQLVGTNLGTSLIILATVIYETAS